MRLRRVFVFEAPAPASTQMASPVSGFSFGTGIYRLQHFFDPMDLRPFCFGEAGVFFHSLVIIVYVSFR